MAGPSRVSLVPHPAYPAPDLRITANAERAGAVLSLHFEVVGAVDAVRWPGRATPDRTDGLWRTTCFEAFLAIGGEAYIELNISPSTAWAAYQFSGYRQGMASLEVEPPRMTAAFSAHGFRLAAEIDLSTAPGPSGRSRCVGLSAVIEDTPGGLSYWALHHPSDKPDFHHPDSFVLELPPP